MSNILEEPSVSSENSIEDSNKKIETNQNQNQLVFFRSYDEDSKSNLSICPDENPIWIKFPKIYLDHNVLIFLIGPDSDDKRDILMRGPLPSFVNLIDNKEILFMITEERLNLKLDLFGYQFLEAKEDKAGDIDINKEAYKRNTARLLIYIYDRLERPCLRYKLQMIRNTNFLDLEVSKDISIRTTKMEECQCLIEFTHHVPNSAKEMKVKITKIYDIFLINKPSNTEICFLINQIKFDKQKSLKRGSKIDNGTIEKVFTTTLNYDVRPLISCTTEELKAKIEKNLKDIQGYHEHIVVFVLSHGDINGFCTKDGYIEFDDFVKIFRQHTDKPIIFFFSCCQGKEKGQSVPFFKIKDLSKSPNIFMGFATVPGYDDNATKKGTPYIQSLLEVIKKNPKLEITEIHEKTESLMREKWKEYEQIPCSYDLL